MKHFGLIGFPLKNTFSIEYMSKLIKSAQIDAIYRNFELESIEFLPQTIQKYQLSGFNVTRPYKRSVIPYLTNMDDGATETDSVNTVKLENGKLIGYNTDIYGFKESLIQFLNVSIKHALILGDGGVAQTVKFVLKELQIPFQVVSSIKKPNTLIWRDLTPELVQKSKLIVQCTPLGMFPNVDAFPEIPFASITPDHFVYDLIYLPEETEFLKKCRRKGAKTKNGLQMLHLQADKSFAIWNQ